MLLQEKMNQEARWKGNPYGRNGQEPKRMYRPKPDSKTLELLKAIPEDVTSLLNILQNKRAVDDVASEDEIKLMRATPEELPYITYEIRAKLAKEKHDELAKDPRVGLELTGRHRYGDDYDILRNTFTMTNTEIAEERMALVTTIRDLHWDMIRHARNAPKVEKYGLAKRMTDSTLELNRYAIQVKKKYYRKNLLEAIDIELDILRDYIYLSHIDYEAWTTTKMRDYLLESCNKVGRVLGGLLKSTVV